MSYYVVVEDNTPPPIPTIDIESILFDPEDLVDLIDEKLREGDAKMNWVVALIIFYVFIISVMSLFYARALDLEDFWMLTQTDEGVEDIPAMDHNPKKRKLFFSSSSNVVKKISLITWIFHRKVLIEPYCMLLTKGFKSN